MSRQTDELIKEYEQAKQGIFDTLFRFIDRMEDPCDEDPLERSAQDLVDGLREPFEEYRKADDALTGWHEITKLKRKIRRLNDERQQRTEK